MPPSAHPATSGPSNVSKRTMSDAESIPHDTKKPRRSSSAEPTVTRDPTHRDAKRRKKRRKKAPVVSPAQKYEATQRRQDERSRAPLSTRNEFIRFASAEADPTGVVSTARYSPQAPSSEGPSQSRQGSSQILHCPSEPRDLDMASTTQDDKKWTDATARSPPQKSLEEKIAQLEAELQSKSNLIASHQAVLNQVQQAVTCQVCLDLMYKPYALAPCGHLACHSCLVNWFTAPPPDNRPAHPAIRRRKTCPHCRAVVRERPIEVWGVKGIARAVGKSGLLSNQLPVPAETPESVDANADPWKDIFPKAGATARRGFNPYYFPDADIDDHDIHIADIAPRGEDVGMLDLEDGGIYRCLDCMHEIWGGVCSSCGRVYPGHRPEDDDDEAEAMGWLGDPLVAEEVDMADDPVWMDLEDGEADDAGDFTDWDHDPYIPWRRRIHAIRGPLGFLGTIHVEEEDEDDLYGLAHGLRDAEEDEGSEDESYESSFIDDEEGGTVSVEGSTRIYEIGDDEGEEHDSDRHSRVVDLDSDGGDQPGDYSDGVPGPRRARRRLGSNDDTALPRHIRRRRGGSRFVGSDGSDAYWSEG